MRHSLEPKYRKYVQGYDFLSFARIGDLIGNKIADKITSVGRSRRDLHSTRKKATNYC